MILIRLLWRWVVTTIAYLVAALAAGLFLLAAHGITDLELLLFGASNRYYGESALVGTITGLAIVLSTYGPALVAIVICEAFRLRSWIVYVLAGVATGLLGSRILSSFFFESFIHPPADLTLVSACGAVGGLVYWLIAGRSAGIATQPPAPSTKDPANASCNGARSK